MVNTSIQDYCIALGAFETLGEGGKKAFVHYFFYRTPTSFLAQDGHIHVSYVCRVKKTQFLEEVWKAGMACSWKTEGLPPKTACRQVKIKSPNVAPKITGIRPQKKKRLPGQKVLQDCYL